jgi:hypothetical protein
VNLKQPLLTNIKIMENINWIAFVVAALSTLVVGFLWYGPLFGKAWMKET